MASVARAQRRHFRDGSDDTFGVASGGAHASGKCHCGTGCHSYTSLAVLPSVSSSTPDAATHDVSVAGDLITLSCGECMYPLAAVTITRLRAVLPPLARILPPAQLAVEVGRYMRRAAVAIPCPQCGA